MDSLIPDTLAAGAWFGPKKLPFGYLIAKLGARKIVPAMSFDQALPILCISSGMLNQSDTLSEKEIAEFYERNPEWISLPDSGLGRSMILPAFALPASVRRFALEYGEMGKTLGGDLDYGFWSISLTEAKPPKGALPFARAKAGLESAPSDGMEPEAFDIYLRQEYARETLDKERKEWIGKDIETLSFEP